MCRIPPAHLDKDDLIRNTEKYLADQIITILRPWNKAVDICRIKRLVEISLEKSGKPLGEDWF